MTFAAIEAQGVEAFLGQIDELIWSSARRCAVAEPEEREYRRMEARSRVLSDSCDPRPGGHKVRSSSYWNRSSRRTSNRGSFGYRPQSGQRMKRSNGWRKAIVQRKTRIIDIDLRSYFRINCPAGSAVGEGGQAY